MEHLHMYINMFTTVSWNSCTCTSVCSPLSHGTPAHVHQYIHHCLTEHLHMYISMFTTVSWNTCICTSVCSPLSHRTNTCTCASVCSPSHGTPAHVHQYVHHCLTEHLHMYINITISWNTCTCKSICSPLSRNTCTCTSVCSPLSHRTPAHVDQYVDHCLLVCLFVGCVTSQQHAECISGTDLHRQFYVLPHWDRSCRSNFPSHPVTVYWHRADQSQCWPYNARRLAG